MQLSTSENTEPNPIKIKGETLLALPKDLYIPPDAMKVFLETFEGPLDLLLYLIRKENLNILDIPIAAVTKQYMEYIDLMKEISLELAAEYLVMAAILGEIKSRMLLPTPILAEAIEEDPRTELIRRLQEYERFKQAAEDIDNLPRQERDLHLSCADSSLIETTRPLPSVNLTELIKALKDILKRAELTVSHHIQQDSLSVREKMSYILSAINPESHTAFSDLFDLKEGRLGVVVTFLALLELLKQSLIEFIQPAPFAPIYLKPVLS